MGCLRQLLKTTAKAIKRRITRRKPVVEVVCDGPAICPVHEEDAASSIYPSIGKASTIGPEEPLPEGRVKFTAEQYQASLRIKDPLTGLPMGFHQAECVAEYRALVGSGPYDPAYLRPARHSPKSPGTARKAVGHPTVIRKVRFVSVATVVST
ncbi:hypothetical protein W97_00752 [Coniosporium apollinis CBS 100218]|uniref:Uncharacterized protein n=1 Tax=Coniosporium apollinis (strain CBS 100218) TaxID=1168221 RepID=R7YI09_CONA1|nr:uncharacterized protein W97_00752 [Coniosporium apollinis CBS 100218]EON61537.1 hypothetical protein W97_00752 [Coniosporium apollinis CBS 100218]